MTAVAKEVLLEQFSKFVAERIGLHFPRERWRDLERGVHSTAKELGFKENEAFLRHTLSSPLTRSQLETLASNLTIGETYFYRENKAFELIEKRILPELLHSRRSQERRLRVWSAGCCTGEEPYSLAISLSKTISNLKDWNITILATDINPRFLEKASRATYSEWSLRNSPRWLREKYLIPMKDGRYQVAPDIKKMVTFSYLNLAEDNYPTLLNNTNAMDIILCRNVLMYFTPAQTKKVIHNLYNSLVDNGWLMVSSIETSPVLYSQFTSVDFHGLTVYNKNLSSRSEYPAPDSAAEFNLPFDIPDFNSGQKSAVAPSLEIPPLPGAKKKKTVEVQPTPYEEALVLYGEGQYAKVIEKLLALFAPDQVNSEVAALLSKSYANEGKLVDALEWCEKAVAGDKLNPNLYYLQATILEEQGTIEEAVVSLKRALYLDQDFILAHFTLGNLYLRRGKSKPANKHFENAISLLKRYPVGATVPESGGITAERLKEIIESARPGEKHV